MAQVPVHSLPVDPVTTAGPSLASPPEPTFSPPNDDVCSRCGGSGRLRINDDSFRTCLDCLGRGVQQSFAGQSSLAEWITPAALRSP